MDSERKIRKLERQNRLLELQNKKLNNENEKLLAENVKLLADAEYVKWQLDIAEATIREFKQNISEIKEYKEKYKTAYADIISMKKEYNKRFKRALRELGIK